MDYFHPVYLTINREKERKKDCEGKAEELARNAAIEETRTHTHIVKVGRLLEFQEQSHIWCDRSRFQTVVQLPGETFTKARREIPSGRRGRDEAMILFFFVKVVFEKGRLAVGRIFWRMGERRYREISRSSVLNFLQKKCKCWIEEEMSWDNVREKYENPPLRWDFWMKNMKKGRGRGRVVEMLEDVQLEYVKVRRVWIGRGDEEILIVVKKGREEDFFRFLD